MTVVMIAGGIDLSVGSNFALANVTALALLNVARWPVAASVVATLGVGALAGLVNGLLIGFLRLRAFLTTLVILTLIRAIVEFLLQIYSVRIASSDVEPPPGISSAREACSARPSASSRWRASRWRRKWR